MNAGQDRLYTRHKSMLKSLKLLADSTRVRILALLKEESLHVTELQEILGMGQSRISTQLAQLKNHHLVTATRLGKNTSYTLQVSSEIRTVLEWAIPEVDACQRDREALAFLLKKKADRTRLYFDNLAGKLGDSYMPGRSSRALAEGLLSLLPTQRIVDLGAGEGELARMLGLCGHQVIAIDNASQMVAYGTEQARKEGLNNLQYRLGDIENPPLEEGSVDMAIFSQSLHHATHPQRALESCYRILSVGGKVLILDLLAHQFEEARELYADSHLGFEEWEIEKMLRQSGFRKINVRIADREASPPFFSVLLATGEKGESP